MIIETKRLCLRPVKASDVTDLFKIYGDPATNAFNPAGPYPDIDYAKLVLDRWIIHWKNNEFGNWAIALLSDPDKIIGFGGLSIHDYAGITINNLGYRFSTEVWGKGLATEFCACATRYGFNDINLTEISAVVRENHLLSQRVLEKTGLKFIRKIYDVKNAPPRLLYSLTFNEWLIESK